ncbi:FmdB family zinc ribbon protein [Carnimonas bestiolae]|uniref:FmdB family zinc ribbon protein n=1 Tax=Carnimonas bestiolae TaxID=3402172 RepID=UPI003EDC93BF
MPIYEYECRDCGHHVEKLQRMNAAPLSECPECHHSALQRMVSAPGFRLAGSGWYETDFKTSGKHNLASDSGAPATGKSND